MAWETYSSAIGEEDEASDGEPSHGRDAAPSRRQQFGHRVVDREEKGKGAKTEKSKGKGKGKGKGKSKGNGKGKRRATSKGKGKGKARDKGNVKGSGKRGRSSTPRPPAVVDRDTHEQWRTRGYEQGWDDATKRQRTQSRANSSHGRNKIDPAIGGSGASGSRGDVEPPRIPMIKLSSAQWCPDLYDMHAERRAASSAEGEYTTRALKRVHTFTLGEKDCGELMRGTRANSFEQFAHRMEDLLVGGWSCRGVAPPLLQPLAQCVHPNDAWARSISGPNARSILWIDCTRYKRDVDCGFDVGTVLDNLWNIGTSAYFADVVTEVRTWLEENHNWSHWPNIALVGVSHEGRHRSVATMWLLLRILRGWGWSTASTTCSAGNRTADDPSAHDSRAPSPPQCATPSPSVCVARAT